MVDFVPLPPFAIKPRPKIFLGLDPGHGYQRCWTGDRDSVGVIGPPGYGKSSGILIPALLWWSGPAVVTSTRGDLLMACGNWRRRLAEPRGGSVFVYDPFNSEGLGSLRWSPLADCDDPSVCYRRVAAMTAVVGRGISEGDHWRSGAALILRGMFHAAALSGRSIIDVRGWLARQTTQEPAGLLRASPAAAAGWADDLEAVNQVGERERGSFYSVARTCMDAMAEPHVSASCSAVDLDIDRFLTSCSTLFVVGPSHYQEALAPLIVALVDAIAHRAAELAAKQGGRLDPPLLLGLDEIANIAPLRSLPALVSEGGGRGIHTLWAAQSLAQLRARYGVHEQQAIVTATTAKIVYGGMSNGSDLRDISGWAGEHRESQTTRFSGAVDPRHLPAPGPMGGITGGTAGDQYSVSGLYRPVLPSSALQQAPPFYPWLFYRSDPPMMIETRPAGLVDSYRAVSGFTPAERAP